MRSYISRCAVKARDTLSLSPCRYSLVTTLHGYQVLLLRRYAPSSEFAGAYGIAESLLRSFQHGVI